MRLTTIFGTAMIALSTAAIAQVASTPVEQKGADQAPANAANAADDAVSGAPTPPGNTAPVATTSSAPARATPAAGNPAAATGKPPK